MVALCWVPPKHISHSQFSFAKGRSSTAFSNTIADLSNQYVSHIELLCPDLTVSSQQPADDVINTSKSTIFRSTTAFVNHFEASSRRYVFNPWYITHACLQGVAYNWYANAPDHIWKATIAQPMNCAVNYWHVVRLTSMNNVINIPSRRYQSLLN